MGMIRVDKTRFLTGREDLLQTREPALWTFAIREQNICFWGSFPEAEHTARLYAAQKGMTQGTITLMDCAGPAAARMSN